MVRDGWPSTTFNSRSLRQGRVYILQGTNSCFDLEPELDGRCQLANSSPRSSCRSRRPSPGRNMHASHRMCAPSSSTKSVRATPCLMKGSI